MMIQSSPTGDFVRTIVVVAIVVAVVSITATSHAAECGIEDDTLWLY